MLAGFHLMETGIGARLVVLGSIAYAAWAGRRAAGLLLAVAAGGLELARRAPAEHAVAFVVPWLLVFITIALVSSGIEAATRPDTR